MEPGSLPSGISLPAVETGELSADETRWVYNGLHLHYGTHHFTLVEAQRHLRQCINTPYIPVANVAQLRLHLDALINDGRIHVVTRRTRGATDTGQPLKYKLALEKGLMDNSVDSIIETIKRKTSAEPAFVRDLLMNTEGVGVHADQTVRTVVDVLHALGVVDREKVPDGRTSIKWNSDTEVVARNFSSWVKSYQTACERQTLLIEERRALLDILKVYTKDEQEE